jgi:predicted nucleotide-binding protein (sugar kinase/HSP70/actin superfamily)
LASLQHAVTALTEDRSSAQARKSRVFLNTRFKEKTIKTIKLKQSQMNNPDANLGLAEKLNEPNLSDRA